MVLVNLKVAITYAGARMGPGQTETIIMTPSVFGFNMDSTPSTTCYMKIENQHTASQNITVSVKYLQLEV